MEAEDAVLLDNSDISEAEAEDRILELLRERKLI